MAIVSGYFRFAQDQVNWQRAHKGQKLGRHHFSCWSAKRTAMSPACREQAGYPCGERNVWERGQTQSWMPSSELIKKPPQGPKAPRMTMELLASGSGPSLAANNAPGKVSRLRVFLLRQYRGPHLHLLCGTSEQGTPGLTTSLWLALGCIHVICRDRGG